MTTCLSKKTNTLNLSMDVKTITKINYFVPKCEMQIKNRTCNGLSLFAVFCKFQQTKHISK